MADVLAKQGARGTVQLFPAMEVADGRCASSLTSDQPLLCRVRTRSGGPKARPPWDGVGEPWFMKGPFAATDPLLSWDSLATVLVDSAQSVVGRKAPACRICKMI